MTPNVLFCGAIDREQGVLDFLHALAQLHADGIAFRATVVGRGPDFAVAKNLRRKLGLHRLVAFAEAEAEADTIDQMWFDDADLVIATPGVELPPGTARITLAQLGERLNAAAG